MVGREGRIGGGEKEGGWKRTHRGQHNEEKGILAGCTLEVSGFEFNCKQPFDLSLSFSSFFFPSPYTLPSLAWRLISMLLKVTTGHVRAFLWFIFSSYNAIMLWILLGKLLISSGRSGKQILAWHSSCLFIIQSGGNIFLETVFKWLCLLISSTVQTSIRHNPNTCFHLWVLSSRPVCACS